MPISTPGGLWTYAFRTIVRGEKPGRSPVCTLTRMEIMDRVVVLIRGCDADCVGRMMSARFRTASGRGQAFVNV